MFVIPAVYSNAQNKQMYASFVAANEALNNMLKNSMLQHGPLKRWDFSSGNSSFDNYFLAQLDLAKDCGTGTGCFANTNTYTNVYGTTALPQAISDGLNAARKVILASGVSLGYNVVNSTCTPASGGGTGDPKYCAAFYIDTNGEKLPNRLGKDFFQFNLYQFYDFIAPTGVYKDKYDSAAKAWEKDSTDASAECKDEDKKNGIYCGAYMLQSKEMDY